MDALYNPASLTALGYSHLLEILDPRPAEPEGDGDGEEEEEEEEERPAVEDPPYLVAQRAASDSRIEIESDLMKLELKLAAKTAIVDGLVTTAPFDSTYQRKITKAEFNNAVNQVGLRDKVPSSKRRALLEELQLKKLEPEPEIAQQIREKKQELEAAKRTEEDASIICIGHRAAAKTHSYDAHPISVTFDAAYIGDGSLWANATIEVTDTVADRMSDIMLVVDNSAAMADMLPMVGTILLKYAVASHLTAACCSDRSSGVCSTWWTSWSQWIGSDL
jgi:hypothetical protein